MVGNHAKVFIILHFVMLECHFSWQVQYIKRCENLYVFLSVQRTYVLRFPSGVICEVLLFLGDFQGFMHR